MPDIDLITLSQAFSQIADKRVFFDPLHGNNGDELISMGARHLLKQHNISLSTDVAQADAIVVTGGAGLSSVWGGAYEEVSEYCRGALAKKPLVILPSTMSFEKFDFASKLNERSGITMVFARERKTLARMLAQSFGDHVQIGLDHDMAFQLSDSSFLANLKKKGQQKHILIVERRDAESLAGKPEKAVRAPSKLKRLIPEFVKRKIKLRWHEQERSSSDFARWSSELIAEHFPDINCPETRYIDCSLRGLVSFDRFCELINQASVVVTTRLHVAILSALLGKQTIIVPGCPKYGKIQGIYEHSMAKMKHVQIVSNPFLNQ